MEADFPASSKNTTGYMNGTVTINGAEQKFKSNYVYRDEQQGTLRFFAHMSTTPEVEPRTVIAVQLKSKDAGSGEYKVGDPQVVYFWCDPAGSDPGLNAQSGTLELSREDGPVPKISGTLKFEARNSTRTYQVKVSFELLGIS